MKSGFYSRWAVLASGLVVNAFSTFSYAYGLFSGSLKQHLGFSQDSIALIASVGELGLWSSFLVGLILERVAPHKVYWLASVFVSVGLVYIGLAIDKSLPATAESVALAFFIANFGSACLGCAAQTVVVKNFPARDRGKLSGLIKSIFALSATVQTVLFLGFFDGEHAAHFLIFLATFVSVLAIITAFPLEEIPGKYASSYALERAQGVNKSLKPVYWYFSTLTVCLIICVVVNGLGQRLGPWVGVAMVALVFTAFGLPFKYGRVWISTDCWADDGENGLFGISLAKEAEPLLGALAHQPLLSDKDDEHHEACDGVSNGVNHGGGGGGGGGVRDRASSALCHAEAGPVTVRGGGGDSGRGAGDADYQLLSASVTGGVDATHVKGRNRNNSATVCHSEEIVSVAGPVRGGSRGLQSPEAGLVHTVIPDVDMTWRQCLKDKRFYTVFVCFTCGAGAGITVINNIRQIAEADEIESGTVFVSLLGIANALGRLGMGWCSDQVVKRGMPRAVMLCATLLLTAMVDLVLMAGSTSLIYPAVIVAGMCYGACFTLALAMAGDLFGRKHLGTTYGLLDLGPASGSFIFATGTVDIFYQGVSCVGASCFRGTFLVTSAACVTASILAYFVLVAPVLRKGRPI